MAEKSGVTAPCGGTTARRRAAKTHCPWDVPPLCPTLAGAMTAASVVPIEDRRAQILLSAAEVFTEKGYHSTSMDDVAAHAKVSKPVVYQFFASKRDLYLGLLELSVEDLSANIASAVAAHTDNADRVRAAIAYYFDAVDQADHGFRLIFETDLTQDPDVRAHVHEFITRMSRLMGTEIAEATGLPLAEAQLLAAGMSGMAQTAAFRWLRLGRPIPLDEAVSQVWHLGWFGLSSFSPNASQPSA